MYSVDCVCPNNPPAFCCCRRWLGFIFAYVIKSLINSRDNSLARVKLRDFPQPLFFAEKKLFLPPKVNFWKLLARK